MVCPRLFAVRVVPAETMKPVSESRSDKVSNCEGTSLGRRRYSDSPRLNCKGTYPSNRLFQSKKRYIQCGAAIFSDFMN